MGTLGQGRKLFYAPKWLIISQAKRQPHQRQESPSRLLATKGLGLLPLPAVHSHPVVIDVEKRSGGWGDLGDVPKLCDSLQVLELILLCRGCVQTEGL